MFCCHWRTKQQGTVFKWKTGSLGGFWTSTQWSSIFIKARFYLRILLDGGYTVTYRSLKHSYQEQLPPSHLKNDRTFLFPK